MTKKNFSRRLVDGMHSMLTSLGERVAAINYSSARSDIPDRELLSMYKNSWVVKKFIDKTADDMLKLPREIIGGLPDEIKKSAIELENQLNVAAVYREALTWASLLGDSLIVAITDCEDEAIEKPLSLESEDIVKFLVLSKGEYQPNDRVISDIDSPNFGLPQHYVVTVGRQQLKFHHTRCHRTRLGKHRLKDMKRFGTSDLQAPYQAIKIFDTAILSTGDTIQEANVDVIFLAGLNSQIAAGQESQVVEYARVVKDTKSSTGILLIDAGEEGKPSRYEQKNAQFTGLSDVVTKMANVLAGALDRPITVLFGQSASGFASGEEDNKAYYATINGLQESRLRPMQDFVDQFILDKLSAWTGEPLAYEYPSIANTNETEEATRFSNYATGFTSLVQSSIVTEDIALREMQARGVLTTITAEDVALAKTLNANGGDDWSSNNSWSDNGDDSDRAGVS
ncbi:DUF1073 domain-containing protein [uncultured Serratia sp.]|uniref:phage portal protein n=1 Tax=uncultured Serratia sp. TaxID=239175 RepID=UPI00258B3C10|nr:DUF1073 domain-containing protein [uncultured Serratia sp.]